LDLFEECSSYGKVRNRCQGDAHERRVAASSRAQARSGAPASRKPRPEAGGVLPGGWHMSGDEEQGRRHGARGGRRRGAHGGHGWRERSGDRRYRRGTSA
jgi:hypothetical protein